MEGSIRLTWRYEQLKRPKHCSDEEQKYDDYGSYGRRPLRPKILLYRTANTLSKHSFREQQQTHLPIYHLLQEMIQTNALTENNFQFLIM
jgi:hypothetical protein